MKPARWKTKNRGKLTYVWTCLSGPGQITLTPVWQAGEDYDRVRQCCTYPLGPGGSATTNLSDTVSSSNWKWGWRKAIAS